MHISLIFKTQKMKSFKSNLLIILVTMSLFSNSSCGQNTNQVDFKSQGVSLTIPEGWVGQETVGGYAFASTTTSGFILVTTNNYTNLAMMEQQARLGIANGNDNYLQLVGDIVTYNTIVIGGEYQGAIEGYAAKAYIINVANETGGSGISIMVSTNTNQYSNFYKQLCENIANTVEIYPPVQNSDTPTKPITSKNEMEELFGGARLTYYDTGDGYATKIVIDLCEQGYFYHSSSDTMSADVGGVSAGYGDNGNGAGAWRIIIGNNVQDVLQLTFRGNKIYEYYISLENGETYLDNRRYFREYGDELGARCY